MTGLYLDRVEGDRAVLVDRDGRERRIAVDRLPPGAREGVYLTEDLAAVDEAATREAVEATRKRREKLSRDDDGGDFSL